MHLTATLQTPRISPVMTYRERIMVFLVFICLHVGLLFVSVGSGQCQGWSELTIRLLPDDAFSLVEVADGGAKTRHLPHHDLNAQVDEEQLIYVLGTLKEEDWLYPHNGAVAGKHLERHYGRLILKMKKVGLQDKINLNTATLTDLVRLPNIGPALAVKIVDYRDTHSRYESIGDIRKVEGIGDGTFVSIRYYVKTD